MWRCSYLVKKKKPMRLKPFKCAFAFIFKNAHLSQKNIMRNFSSRCIHIFRWRRFLMCIVMKKHWATSDCRGDYRISIAQLCWLASRRWSNQQQRSLFIKENDSYTEDTMIKKKNNLWKEKTAFKHVLNSILLSLSYVENALNDFKFLFIYYLRLQRMNFTWLKKWNQIHLNANDTKTMVGVKGRSQTWLRVQASFVTSHKSDQEVLTPLGGLAAGDRVKGEH